MVRSERLISLLQILRRHKRPVSGALVANELGISLRTLYRDISSLQSQGANIEGEPGVGYVLRSGFMLPPMMFSQAELEALLLGFRWVSKLADEPMIKSATDAISKIEAVLPERLKAEFESNSLLVGPRSHVDQEKFDLGIVRQAIRNQQKLHVTYADASGRRSDRTIWPFALGYFPDCRILVGWCELREDYRHFRSDRIVRLSDMAERYTRSRSQMLRHWRNTRASMHR